MDVGSDPYSLVVSERAKKDIDSAVAFFDESQMGLGAEFYEEFVAIARLITVHPQLYEEKILFARRGLMKRFRFQLFYAVDDVHRKIDVIAVLHQKQDPAIILQRLNIDL